MFSGKTMRTNLHSEKSFTMVSRGDRIRTYDPLVPNQSDQQIPPTKTQGIHEPAESVAPTVALESPSFATFDPQVSRLLELFSVADAAQRTAILSVAEAIVPTSCKSQSNAT